MNIKETSKKHQRNTKMNDKETPIKITDVATQLIYKYLSYT